MERNPSQIDPVDRQIRRLAGQLRDTGVAPDRDLWPDIDASMDSHKQTSGNGISRRRGPGRLRMAAVAAALVAMLAAGWAGIRTITTDADFSDVAGPTAEQTAESPRGLSVIDQALDELTLALADDPENRNLSHLVLMVHKTRGNLLRRNTENLVRD
jgi:hypothetical protein